MTKRSLTAYFKFDHDRLDGLFQQFRDALPTDLRAATTFFRQFQHGTQRHIDMEEELMFPMYETRAGVEGHRPIADMCEDHRQIRALMTVIDQKLSRQDAALADDVAKLVQVMSAHHHREEAIVYALIDDTLSDADRDQVFARLDTLREAA